MGNAVEDHSAELIPAENGPAQTITFDNAPVTPPAPNQVDVDHARDLGFKPRKIVANMGEYLPPHEVQPASPLAAQNDIPPASVKLEDFAVAATPPHIWKLGEDIPREAWEEGKVLDAQQTAAFLGNVDGELTYRERMREALPGTSEALAKLTDELIRKLPPGFEITHTYLDENQKLHIDGIAPKDFYEGVAAVERGKERVMTWVDEAAEIPPSAFELLAGMPDMSGVDWNTPEPETKLTIGLDLSRPETAEDMIKRQLPLHEYLGKLRKQAIEIDMLRATVAREAAEKAEFSDWAVYCECMMKDAQDALSRARAEARCLHDNLADAYDLAGKLAAKLAAMEKRNG